MEYVPYFLIPMLALYSQN